MALKKNDRGPEVVKLQRALLELGCELPRWGADGSLGGETMIALAKLLADHGRTRDDDVGIVSDAELAFVYDLQRLLKQQISLPVPADQFFDMRLQASTDKDFGERSWSKVTGVCLHQTAMMIGEDAAQWTWVGAHIGITRGGKVIFLHDFNRLVVHGNAWNAECVGIEMEGMYAGVEGDPSTFWRPDDEPERQPQRPTPELVGAAKATVRWIKSVVEKRGGHLKILVAHRQSNEKRQSDPGSALWQAVALPLHKELALSDGGIGFKLSGGRPIPEAWDPRCKGIPY